MRNEKSPLEKGFLDAKLVEILKTCPDGEEEVLRSLGYEDLLRQGMKNVFRGGFSFVIAIEKLKAVVMECRRLGAEKSEMTKKYVKKAEEVNMVIEEKIGRIEWNCKLQHDFKEAKYKVGELESELKEWKESNANLLDHVDHLNNHLFEVTGGKSPKYERIMQASQLDSGREIVVDLNVTEEGVRLGM